MATNAQQIQLIIEDKTTYEGNYFPASASVNLGSDAVTGGRFHVRQLTDKAEVGNNRQGYRFLITLLHNSAANMVTMLDTLLKCSTMSGNATYAYKPSTSGYPYYIEFSNPHDWTNGLKIFGSIECFGWWSF